MKLLNHTTAYFAGMLLVIMAVWASIFYVAMLDEIYDSMDDGLDNQRLLVLQRAAKDSIVLQKREFDDGYYKIRPLGQPDNLSFTDRYSDTLMYMQNEDEYEPVRMLKTVFRHNGQYYELRVITSMVEEDDLIMELVESLIWLYFGLIVSVLLLNNFLLKKVWKPFYKLLAQLQQFRLDKPTPVNPPETNIDEFQQLNQTVQKLLQGNQSAYNNQKQFIENAAHELQTPLAISRNKLEQLADSPNLNQTQLQTLAQIMDNLERLTRLNKSLLLLSQIENRQFADETEIDMGALCRQIVADFEDQAKFRNLEITFTEDCPCLRQMHPDLARIMFTNLIKNAIVHNRPQGFVQVYIAAGKLEVANSGAPEPLNNNLIFTRFYKESAANTSTGLGLAVVKAIADMYSFQVTYRFKQKHILTIWFTEPTLKK